VDLINSLFVVAVMLTSLVLADLLVASVFAVLDYFQADRSKRDVPEVMAGPPGLARPVSEYLSGARAAPVAAGEAPAPEPVLRVVAPPKPSPPWTRASRVPVQ
jgi:hypothetical protein